MAKKSRLYTYPNGQPSDGQKVQLEFDNIYEGVNNVDAEQISAGAITGDKLANGSITGLKLDNLSITTAKLADASVTTPKLADSSVTSEKVADNAITTIHIADGSITNAKMQSGGITTDNIIDGAVTSPKIADSSVTNAKLEGNIEQSKILDTGYLTTRIDKKIESEIITSGSFNNIIDITGIGNLEDLTTTNKNNVVSALNEIKSETATQLAQTDKKVDDAFLNLDTFKRLESETDDSGLIQRAINEAFSSKKTIFVPSKTFEFSSTQNMLNGVSFVGQNRENSILKYMGTGVAFNLIDQANNTQNSYGYGCYYNSFKNLSIIGVSAANGSTAIKGELRYSSFTDVTFRKFGTIIDVNNNWANNYINCLFGFADIWYNASSQNNAVTFTGCQFTTARIGFQMVSCYELSIIGGNIEACTSVILLPRRGGGNIWSNFTISNVYFENHAPLIDTNVPSGEGTAITTWALIGFKFSNNHVNFFVTDKAFITTKVSNVIAGTIESCVFYKKDDTTIFDMESTEVLLAFNRYRYFDDNGASRFLTAPLSSHMVSWNSGFQEVKTESVSRFVFSGVVSARKGFDLSYDAFPISYKQGHTRYEPNTKSIHVVNTDNQRTDETVLQPVKMGTTRPPSLEVRKGMMFFDENLGKPIWCKQVSPSIVWVDATGSVV